jgi:hypothetical protein
MKTWFDSALDEIVLLYFLMQGPDPSNSIDISPFLLAAIFLFSVLICIKCTILIRDDLIWGRRIEEHLLNLISTCLTVLSLNTNDPLFLQLVVSVWFLLELWRVFLNTFLLFKQFVLEAEYGGGHASDMVFNTLVIGITLSNIGSSLSTGLYLALKERLPWYVVAIPQVSSKFFAIYLIIMDMQFRDPGDTLFLHSSVGRILKLVHPFTALVPITDITGMILLSVDFEGLLPGAIITKFGECAFLTFQGILLLLSYIHRSKDHYFK